ncbi:MAG: hypothetical protein N3F03_06665 [Ignavibacteria bacterium]|nr:hypothetical protein [Ignavibacteria bacterium]
MKKIIFVVIALNFIVSFNLHADRRYFARSYTSYTLPANALELEIWNTGKIGKDAGYFYRWQPRVEFEYGVTDRLTTSIYFNFDETRSKNNSYPSKSFSLSSTSYEIRYRLSEVGEYFVDPTLYAEVYYGGDKIKYEPKIFLTKRFNNFISVVNINSEIERYFADQKTESKFEVTGGVSYELNNNFAAGIEFRHHLNYTKIYETKKNQAFFIGPTLNIQTSKFYFTINFLAQINGTPQGDKNLDLIGHEKYELRSILGIEL